MFLNNKKMQQVYNTELINIFIDALIKDNQSIYFNNEKYQVIEAIIDNEITFNIDESEVITETLINGQTNIIFKNNKKNAEAIYSLKILLQNYPE